MNQQQIDRFCKENKVYQAFMTPDEVLFTTQEQANEYFADNIFESGKVELKYSSCVTLYSVCPKETKSILELPENKELCHKIAKLLGFEDDYKFSVIEYTFGGKAVAMSCRTDDFYISEDGTLSTYNLCVYNGAQVIKTLLEAGYDFKTQKIQ